MRESLYRKKMIRCANTFLLSIYTIYYDLYIFRNKSCSSCWSWYSTSTRSFISSSFVSSFTESFCSREASPTTICRWGSECSFKSEKFSCTQVNIVTTSAPYVLSSFLSCCIYVLYSKCRETLQVVNALVYWFEH